MRTSWRSSATLVGLVMVMVAAAACQPAEERFDEINGPLADAVLHPDELDVDLSELDLDVDRIVDRVRSSRLQAHVGAFNEPRPDDSPGARRAARYVETTLRHLGYRVERQPATAPNGVTMPNIFSTKRGTECPEKLFVVGGHYDSVAGTPGADDDASGVAGMLEIARVLRHIDLPVSVRFAGFALEENGLVGSGVMAQDLHDRGVDVVGMVSLEMIGYTSESTDVLLGTTQDYLTMFGDLPSLDLARVFGAASLELAPFHFAPAGVIDPAGFPDVLREFRFDEGIEPDVVSLLDSQATNGQLVRTSRTEAIAVARARGQHLIAWWPHDRGDDAPSCTIGAVSVPLSWEQLPDSDEVHDDLDERLWFGASCGGRDLLVGNPHTFRGRMAAWCPHRGRGYSVSMSEMGEMSDETRYFIRGFLSGNEPGPPYDDDHGTDPGDEQAWRSAIRRFRRTGAWYGRWGTCKTCGCVLLPDNSANRCHVHLTET